MPRVITDLANVRSISRDASAGVWPEYFNQTHQEFTMGIKTNSIESKFVNGVQQNTSWVIGVGMSILVLGLLAIASPLVTGVAIMSVIGVLLIIGGVSQGMIAFRAGAFGPGLLLLLTGLVTLVAGGYMVSQPLAALTSITLFIAIYFLVTGVLAVSAALQIRPLNGWGWMLANGVITLLLGLMLWQQWPLSGAWAVGVLFGVQLISTGASLVAIGNAVRSIAKTAE